MRRRRKDVDAYVEAILREKRPPRFGAEDDEARQMLAAAALRAGRPGADAPRPEFVERLERLLGERIAADEALGRAPLVTRRRLLGGAAVAAAAAAVGAGVDRAIDHHAEHGAAPSAELVPTQGTWMDVAAVDAVPVGRPLRFSAGAVEGFLVNHGDNISAVSAICTHLPCTLHFNAGAQRLDCPCHGAWFDLDGKAMNGSDYTPATLPSLPALRTRIVGGRVQVLGA